MEDFKEMENELGAGIFIGNHKGKKLVIGADHRGFEYKEKIKEVFSEFEIVDVGTYSKERCDYPKISEEIGRFIAKDPKNRIGIGICGSGNGILIPASKHKGVYFDRFIQTVRFDVGG